MGVGRCVHICVCLGVQYVFYSEYKMPLFACFFVSACWRRSTASLCNVCMSEYMCEQKGSRKGLWIVQEPVDKSCEHGRGRGVGVTWPGTVCGMLSSPVQHNSPHHHTQQHQKIHGLVQIPSATDTGYVLSYHAQCNLSESCRLLELGLLAMYNC